MIPETKIAVSLYSIGEYCKTEEALDRSLAKICRIGYEAVQLSGVGDISQEKIKGLLDKHGLYCCATHESLDRLTNHMDQVLQTLEILNSPYTALGSPGNGFWREGGAMDLAIKLAPAARTLSDRGRRLGYHNHHQEFWKFDGRTFLEELYGASGPALHMEIDTYWVQRGGADPAEWLRRTKGRSSVVHFKDFGLSRGPDGEPLPCCAEIGEGQLNWPAIVEACRDTGVRWYVVDQDRPRGNRDLFDSLKLSFNNMREMGIR